MFRRWVSPHVLTDWMWRKGGVRVNPEDFGSRTQNNATVIIWYEEDLRGSGFEGDDQDLGLGCVRLTGSTREPARVSLHQVWCLF